MIEIERKFLIRGTVRDIIKADVAVTQWVQYETIKQVYLGDTGSWAIRARRVRSNGAEIGERFLLTMKQRQSPVTNTEIELPISHAIYEAIESQSPFPAVEKTRWYIGRFTVDEFLNPELSGETLAEIELTSEDEEFERPDWLGKEVTGQKKYSNYAIAQRLANA